jgi:hypothetical protein
VVFPAERGIDISCRTVLRWVQTFGPLLAAGVRKHRRRPGTTWYVDEVYFFRRKGAEKRYLYRAVDERGQVLDVRFRRVADGGQVHRLGAGRVGPRRAASGRQRKPATSPRSTTSRRARPIASMRP